MLPFFLFTLGLFYSCLASSYQIDLILFAPRQKNPTNTLLLTKVPLLPIPPNTLTLQRDPTQPYALLPTNLSNLQKESYILQHHSKYQILGHYSWKQSHTHQNRQVALPLINHHGWQIQGTVQVSQSNYYLFRADLQCSPSTDPLSSFTVAQKQRLKKNTVYFLDHPEVGMLVKISG